MRQTEMHGDGTGSSDGKARALRAVARKRVLALMSEHALRLWCHRHISDGRLREARQVLWLQLEHAVRMPGGSPDLVKARQAFIDEGQYRLGVAQGRHAADGKAGGLAHKGRIGAAQRLAGATEQRGDFGFVHPAVTSRDDQHCSAFGQAPKDDAFGDLPDRHAQRVCCLLRGAHGVGQQARFMPVACSGQHLGHALYALWQRSCWSRVG